MQLSDHETAMLAGAEGPARQFAMRQIVEVGRFFDASDCVPVAQVHLMADPEALGPSGVAFLEETARLPEEQRRVRVPAITDPRGVDMSAYKRLGQTDAMADLERRATAAFERLGFLMTNTCINYQSVMPPTRGEHLAFGDTGSTIYANSVLGARSNFEGGPSALAAALTGVTPRYGYHLDRHRCGTTHFEVGERPRDLAEWGALGAIVGRAMRSYWDVPVLSGALAGSAAGAGAPTSDELKQFGAALASFGSTPLFHMPGITPEAPDLAAVFEGPPPVARRIGPADIAQLMASYRPKDDRLDVVVFAAPQLSLYELRTLAGLLAGRRLSPKVALLAATAPDIKAAADRMGLTATIAAAGGEVLAGVCFYQMYAREIGQAQGWTRLLSNSAKLVNILGGYGYEPMLESMEVCVESAVQGRIVSLSG